MITDHVKESFAHAVACFWIAVIAIGSVGALLWMGLNLIRKVTG